MKTTPLLNRFREDTQCDQIHVGLEIGTTKTCVCVAEGNADAVIRILAIGVAPSRGVRKGQIVDPVAAAECIRVAIREAEASVGIEIKSVSVAVTGSHLRSFTSRASLILPKAPPQISLGDTVLHLRNVSQSYKTGARPRSWGTTTRWRLFPVCC